MIQKTKHNKRNLTKRNNFPSLPLFLLFYCFHYSFGVSFIDDHIYWFWYVGLGSIAKTSSARLSLMIDTHHLLTSSDELDTLPPNPTSFEPLPNRLIPSKNSQEPILCFYFSKKNVALRRPPLKLHCDRNYRAR